MISSSKRWMTRYMRSQTGLIITTVMTGIFTLVVVLYLDSRIRVIPTIF